MKTGNDYRDAMRTGRTIERATGRVVDRIIGGNYDRGPAKKRSPKSRKKRGAPDTANGQPGGDSGALAPVTNQP